MARRTGGRRLALVSLESWDEVWRRNQHLAAALLEQGWAEQIVFVEPPRFGRTRRSRPWPGVLAIRPGLIIPRRFGGLRLAAVWLRATRLRAPDLLWVNDAPFGVHCPSRRVPVVYDLTDDWRESQIAPRVRLRLVRAEDRLARRAHTTACSDELARRWRTRYGVDADVIGNGVDVTAVRSAPPHPFPTPGPQVGYVGTLHGDRLDLDLVVDLARRIAPATLHLIGPDHLEPAQQQRLAAEPNIRRSGPVAASDVPGRLAGLDVLVCPHAITPFTLSLDAIKAYEYLATSRPIVATPTSGFQDLTAPGLTVVSAVGFCAAVQAALAAPAAAVSRPAPPTWSQRAGDFAAVLDHVLSGQTR